MDALKSALSKNAVEAMLRKVPKGNTAKEVLTLAYDDAVRRIEAQPQLRTKLAKHVILWVTFAARPLTFGEMQYAVAMQSQEDCDEGDLVDITDLVSPCAGLVIIDEASKIIRFAHYTTQEYFQHDAYVRQSWFGSAELQITMSCLLFLASRLFYERFEKWRYGMEACNENEGSDVSQSSVSDLDQDPRADGVAEVSDTPADNTTPEEYKGTLRTIKDRAFIARPAPMVEDVVRFPHTLLEYACCNWPSHALRAESQDWRTIAFRILMDAEKVRRFTHIERQAHYQPKSIFEDNTSTMITGYTTSEIHGIHYAARHGLAVVVDDLSHDGV